MSGGRGVPQFPGKPQVTGAEEFAWEKQMCPVLTAAEVGAVQTANLAVKAASSTSVIGGAIRAPFKPEPIEARRCQGPACAYFVPIGKHGDGGCAEKMKVTVAHTQQLLLEAIALKLGAIEPVLEKKGN